MSSVGINGPIGQTGHQGIPGPSGYRVYNIDNRSEFFKKAVRNKYKILYSVSNDKDSKELKKRLKILLKNNPNMLF